MDPQKLQLKIDYFRHSLSVPVDFEALPRTLLLETLAATDASGGALYLHENDQFESFGRIHHPSIKRRLVKLFDAPDQAPGALALDQPNQLAATLWQRGHRAGIVYVQDRQSEEPSPTFSALDKALLMAFSATASLALDKAQLAEENRRLQVQRKTLSRASGLVGSSRGMLNLLAQVRQIASSELNVPVLIEGESGTGKELIARALHQLGTRKKREMVILNCAAIPATLLESELFGYEKGAFTGAHKQQVGKFEAADGGLIFLDEIGEMSKVLQAKLLRVLEDGTFNRVGGSKTIRSDFQLLSATNLRLADEVAQGRFREDLYYRLSTFELRIPPLRDRMEDLPLLIRHFLDELNARTATRTIEGLTPQAIRILHRYDWPGNVRQLRRVLERAFVLCNRSTIEIQHLPPALVHENQAHALTFETPILLEQAIAQYVTFAYRQLGSHKSRTMQRLGIDYRRLQRYLDKATQLTVDGGELYDSS